ncbi:hypothetical protein F5Y13DRAFT_156282 [Hypoxylon sp. FL1857]|nr:hypothetical protein F5Y13DRAFT_156282 [Hypoxylon sp. FL1857]
MTSRFVSGGTITGDGHNEPQQPTSASPPRAQDAQWDKDAYKKSAEWEAVQKDLEADRRRREEARRAQVEGGTGGERSLYEILQANKAAKQAAFEEQNRIRNQFRALDDDEIEFLDGVRDERRVEEEKMKRETEERLASFRQAQKAARTTTSAEEDSGNRHEDEEAVAWTGAGKKRRRSDKEVKSIVKGVKRRASEHEKEDDVAAAVKSKPEEVKTETKTKGESKLDTKTDTASKPSATAKPAKSPAPEIAPEKPKPKLGLVDYGSDEDDDD